MTEATARILDSFDKNGYITLNDVKRVYNDLFYSGFIDTIEGGLIGYYDETRMDKNGCEDQSGQRQPCIIDILHAYRQRRDSAQRSGRVEHHQVVDPGVVWTPETSVREIMYSLYSY